MGDLGIPSRILGCKYGTPFTYAAFTKERGLAPGILTFDELMQDLPSRAHQRRHGGFRRRRRSGGTQPQPADPQRHLSTAGRQRRLCAVPGAARRLDDVPEAVRPDAGSRLQRHHPAQGGGHARGQEPAAGSEPDTGGQYPDPRARTASRPTTPITMRRWSRCAATCRALVRATRPRFTSRTVLLLGAGGVARAVAHALHQAEALVTISNRTLDRGQSWLAEVGCRFVRLGGTPQRAVRPAGQLHFGRHAPQRG